MTTSAPESRPGLFRSLGPAIIVASVVLGPGSILAASKNGYQYGYQTVWVLAAAGMLMFGMTVLSARLGVGFRGTLCDELAARLGRPAAVLVGVTLFLVASCFQFSNNLGVLASIEPFYDAGTSTGRGISLAVIVGFNALIISALFAFRALYQPVERLMKVLMGVMIFGFATNLLLARPDLLQIVLGLVPSLPEVPAAQAGAVAPVHWAQRLVPITALFATTFSVGGAFYQSYLVRQKGWTPKDLKQGMFDSAVGIFTLVLVTGMILVTAAAVLHGKPGLQFQTAADVAKQLEPAFGPAAKILFCLGIFAGAFSSFLVNAMIGGTILSDGLGLGGSMDARAPKLFTTMALLLGASVAVFVIATGLQPVDLIILAQSLTVLGNPILAAAIIWLSFRQDLLPGLAPIWMKLLAICGLLMVLVLAYQTATKVYGDLTKPPPTSQIDHHPAHSRLLAADRPA